MSMSYANMIDEKNMKKGFILATLISTVVGTFTTSVGLYDRMADRRHQKQKDSSQDKRLQELQKRVEDAEKRPTEKEKDKKDVKREDLEYSLERSGPQIQRMFDQSMKNYGSQYAQGDTLTQNEIQSQIINLQQAVINVLQNAVMTGREISQSDINKLYIASEAARTGSIDALHSQQQRMLVAGPHGPTQRPLTPPMTPISPIRRCLPPIAPAPSTVMSDDTAPLFCRYSSDLQYKPDMPLSRAFWPGGDNGCPACGIRLTVEQGRTWKITQEVERLSPSARDYDDVVVEELAFNLSNRFVVKCHRENGEFACVLCNQNKDKDTICETASGLVRHVWRTHDVAEYEREMDIRRA